MAYLVHVLKKVVRIVISYIDAIILNGWAMIQGLSYGGYDNVIITLDEIFATTDDSEFGYFVDVDLKYTESTRNKTNYILFF